MIANAAVPSGTAATRHVGRWLAALGILALIVTAVPRPAARWQSRVQARIVAPQQGGYPEQVLGRDAVILTFARVVADGGFARTAGRSIGLTDRQTHEINVEVQNSAGSTMITVLLTGADRAAVARLAPAFGPAAADYLGRLAPLYRLNPGQIDGPHKVAGALLPGLR